MRERETHTQRERERDKERHTRRERERDTHRERTEAYRIFITGSGSTVFIVLQGFLERAEFLCKGQCKFFINVLFTDSTLILGL